MKNYSIALLGVALLAFTACDRPVPPVSDNPNDFDVAAYVQAEIDRLQAKQPAVLKSVKTEDQPDETIQLDQLDWADELAIFAEADINKPTLREYYNREEEQTADGGKIIRFTKTEDAKVPVESLYLEISAQDKLQQLRTVIRDENLLFYSKRSATLESNPETGRIQGYEVKGVQKMIFGDSLRYSIMGTL